MVTRAKYLFLGQTLRSFMHTGAILPSSKALSDAIVRRLSLRDDQKKILEVGPGTGAFTRRILSATSSRDKMDICEINPAFTEYLSKWIRGQVEADQARIRLIRDDICNFEHVPRYDFIVCGIPFYNFPVEKVERIITAIRSVLMPDGVLSYFEYIGLRRIVKPIRQKSRERIKSVELLMSSLVKDYSIDSEYVFRNVPPAVVHHLRFDNKNA